MTDPMQPPASSAPDSPSRRQPVFQYCPSVGGGHPRYVDHLISALARTGRCDLTWVAGTELPARFDRDDRRVWRTIPTIRPRASFGGRAAWLSNRVAYQFRRELALLRAMRRSPAGSVFHLQEWNWLLGALLNVMARVGGRHVVITVHNLRPHTLPPLVPASIVTGLERLVWRTASALVVHADAQREQLRAMLGARCPPIVVAPHGRWSDYPDGHDTHDTHDVHDTVADADRRHASPEASRPALRLLCYGSIRRNKGFDIAVDALTRLRRSATLTIVGGDADPPYTGELRRRVEAARSTGARVALDPHFVPEDEVAALFRRHDLLLLPYGAFEAQSGVLFDAIALGLPVVSSPAGALGQTVAELGIGRVVPTDDPVRWAEALEGIDDEALRRYRDALARAARTSGWETAAKRTAELFDRLVTA